MQTIRLNIDESGLAELILDKEGASANLMDMAFAQDFAAITAQLLGQKEALRGILVTSTKKTFFAGGDLNMLSQVTDDNAEEAFNMIESIKASMRILETLGIPVVACINGAAMGGGWEIALACHHRIAINHKAVRVGLPEVTLGLLPGGGGVTRMTRLFGLEAAMPWLTQGITYAAAKAHSLGWIHQLVDSPEALKQAALDYINATESAQQPWDAKSYKMPGGTPSHPGLAQKLSIAPAIMRAKTRGALPAPEAILASMVEGAQVNFDTATRIESRYFVQLARGQVAKNMINTFWFDLNGIKTGASRPKLPPQVPIKKVGILGAGMMGAGIAYSCAKHGLQVVLKDVSIKSAQVGKAYSQKLVEKAVSRNKMTDQQAQSLLACITPTDSTETLAGCDLIIEAVFEERGLKAKVTQEAEAQLAESAIMASNTSTLPISGLAEASARPAQFIGLHFFSPVDKMPLVEIICGKETDDATLARCYDFVLQIGKTPIAVNDSRGFYTSRVFETFVGEGMAMLHEGVPAATIEHAALLAGFPVGPLAVSDEVSLSLMDKIKRQTVKDFEAAGKTFPSHPSDPVVDRMLELNRSGKLHGAGFYEYPQEAKKHLWQGLYEHFPVSDSIPDLDTLKARFLYMMAIETQRCLGEGVLTSARDANIGSIMGIGYPVWTGGTAQFVEHEGREAFLLRAKALAEAFGDRFTPPTTLFDETNSH